MTTTTPPPQPVPPGTVLPAPRTAAPPPRPAAPLPPARRSLAPDLARGAVLLFIALANVSGWLYGREVGAGYRPRDGTQLDRGLDLLVSLFVDHRSYPLFAMLFGYGMWQILRSAERRGAGWTGARRTLMRRNSWLVAFGLVHIALLFAGDILLSYGAAGLVALLLLRRSTRTLLVWVGACLLVTAGLWAGVAALSPATFVMEPPSSYLGAATGHLTERLMLITVELPVRLAPLLLGVLIGRAGLLDRPWEHTRLLARTAVLATTVSVAGGIPFALMVAGVIDSSPALQDLAQVAHILTGTAGGAGYLAGFALLAAVLHGRPRTGLVRALGAVGQRSLSCYLLQSVLFFALLSVWGLGLGATMGTAGAYGVAAAVWLTTVLVAVRLDRAGRRGPAEVLLRRLTYGRARA